MTAGNDKLYKIKVFATAMLILFAGAFVLENINTTNAKDENVVIKASVNKDCTGTPWFVGQEKGFFKDGGVDLVDVGQIAAPQRPAAFASGQLDVFDNHPSYLINFLKAGVPIIAVAQGGDEPRDGDIAKQHMHWLVLDNSTLKKPEDIANFNGKVKIGTVNVGTCVDTENNALLRKYGIPKDKVEYVVLPDAQQEQALRQGLIDISIVHPPFYTAAEKHGGVHVLATSTEAFGPAAGQTLIMFTKDFIKNNPDAVRKFLRAYKASEKWTNAHREEAGEITAKKIGLEAANAHYYSDSGKVNEEELQVWIDALVTDGVIQKGQYTVKDLYTDEFKDVW